MKGFLRFILRHHFFLLFLLLEGIALHINISTKQDKKIEFQNATNIVSGFLYDQFHSINRYFHLKEINEKLTEENERLRNTLSSEYGTVDSISNTKPSDTSKQFKYISAEVINNSVNKNHNYITLNRGRKDGIQPEMGVISSKGLVGIVRDVSRNYSLVISLLNTELGISAKIKNKRYFGSMRWNGSDPQFTKLHEIPSYANVTKGDTLVTSGYSAIFPKGIRIGIVNAYELSRGTNFYDITVKLTTEFNRLHTVYIIKNTSRDERKKLENLYTGQ